jgi:murein DD-endopeptidase MepM/ murein hydrolase activator NlpD
MRPSLVMKQLLLLSLLLACSCQRNRAPEAPTPDGPITRALASVVPPPPYQGAYRLPFDGEWVVLAVHYKGSRESPQAFAVDIAPGPMPKGKGVAPDKFGCWGKPILADGPGVVALAVDGIHDNIESAVPNKYDLHGNYVVIDHRNGEFSLFAHLRQGSVSVRAGQVVQLGQTIGLCGNSGRSFRPHVHWQVMSHAYTQYARGLPIRHLPFLANGEPATGRLERGQRVRMP